MCYRHNRKLFSGLWDGGELCMIGGLTHGPSNKTPNVQILQPPTPAATD